MTTSTLVLGNIAGDADSVVSSIVLASILTSQGIPSKAVLNFPKSELSLRLDVVRILTDANIDTATLYHIDTLPECKGDVILVDHNEVVPQQRHLFPDSRIVGIYYHHTDIGKHQHLKVRIIKPVGSCCTLLMQDALKSGLSDVMLKCYWTPFFWIQWYPGKKHRKTKH